MGGLTNPACRVRRATLDDLPALSALWGTMGFPVEELARRVTEFQVAETAGGVVVGALGLQLAERQGLIHGEAFSDFSLAEPIRPLFWERLNSLARNHGLLRLWTREQSPFWRQCGLEQADGAALERLPAVWRGASGGWLTLKLREDLDTLVAMDGQLAMFLEAERQRSRQLIQQARLIKGIVTVLALAVVVAILLAAFYLVRKSPYLRLPGN